MTRAGALSMALAVSFGCGARGGVLDDAPADASARDTGRPDGERPDSAAPDSTVPDSARPDSSLPDAGVERCEPTITLEPKRIAISPGDRTADRPQVEERGGFYYLLHAMRDDSGEITLYGNPYDAILEPSGGLSSDVGDALEPYVTATSERHLGYCFETTGGVTLVGDPSSPSMPGRRGTRISYAFGSHCHDLVSNGRSWLVGFSSDLGPRGVEPLVMLATDDLAGLLTMPVPAFPETFRAERELRATVLRDGSYAYSAEPTFERLLEVGFIDDGGRVDTVVVPEIIPTGSAPGIAPWPYDSSLVAIAHNFPEGVRVLVIRRDGREVLRTEPFTFSMAGDVTPALVALPGGLIVGTLDYGDFDPTGGNATFHVIDADGSAREILSRPTRRGSLEHGGIDGLGSRERAVFYWAEMGESPVGPAPATQALIVECPRP